MATITLHEIQQDVVGYLERVRSGETLVVTEKGQPLAEIKPLASAPAKGLRPFGLAKGQFVMPDNFDDPLPEEVLRLFEGEG
jgi:prevent-host-death family protein